MAGEQHETQRPPTSTADIGTEKPAGPPRYPTVPPVDERANAAFLDAIFDTDGRPNAEAQAVVEIEGLDEDEEDDR